MINDYADRWLDPNVERTKHRPLAGAVSGREALAVFAVLMLVAFALVLTSNRLGGADERGRSHLEAPLSPPAILTKRHTYLPQVYLGMFGHPGWASPR